MVVGGPQYRAGAHRHFVQLARALAGTGHAVLRFDARGMGDSTGEQRNFESLSDDIGAGIDALVREAPGTAGVVLWGLCDAASAALLYLHERQDRRVTGLCLMNPWVRAPETLARAHVNQHYMRQVFDAQAWRRLLSGGIGLRALADFCRTVWLAFGSTRGVSGSGERASKAAYQARMVEAWRDFDGEVLLSLSGKDLTAAEFLERAQTDPTLRAVLARRSVSRLDLTMADHTLSDAASRSALERATLSWLELPTLRSAARA
jgi:exosortase A-associated hydrolase 1